MGGQDGPLTEVLLNGDRLEDEIVDAGGIVLQRDEDQLTIRLPGGAGYGDAALREPTAAEADLRSGVVTRP
jgi:N-methylhydantoinase B/oxoprolinase/acetone carboxylase alpha subunit